MLASLTALRLADCNQLALTDPNGDRPHLIELLARLAADLPALSEAITQNYLSHLQASRHLSSGLPAASDRWAAAGELDTDL